MFSKKNTKKGFVLAKKGFTLIEMLIVIVIIGILMAALIPRLSSARGRANDVARKSHLSQVATALISYQIDHGKFPPCSNQGDGCTLVSIEDELIGAGLSSIPTDPNANRVISAGMEGTFTAGQYAYIPIKKRGIDNNGFVLMAATETEGGSNRLTENVIGSTSYDEYENISADICKEFGNNTPCDYDENGDELRYIYLY